MKIKSLADKTGMTIKTGNGDKEVEGIYVCDLLSWVISHAKLNDLWVTVMNNVNIIAVASLSEVACIVISENINIDENVLRIAEEKDVTILSSSLTSAEIVIKVNALLC